MTIVSTISQPIIVGAGLAGLSVALRLAPIPVTLLSHTSLGGESSSLWAQGGLAAAMGEDDGVALHVSDTLAAGDGLCDADVVERILDAAPAAIAWLETLGICFDRKADGAWALGLEAAHGRRRIVHCGGDGIGRALIPALAAAARGTPSITVLEGVEARRLTLCDGAITGVWVVGGAGSFWLPSDRVVIATGGIGGLFADSTNPLACAGQGLALAAQAGAAMRDLEFVQFHPTALLSGIRPMPLISEAVRGEGAALIDETGARFLSRETGAELAPRDVLTRQIWRHEQAGHHVYLDARASLGARFAERFPAIAENCRKIGVNPALDPIPVRPAQHYHMGGIMVDAAGRSSVQGLWACGEAASTGLHGANRLASNSLIEAVCCAAWVAESVAACDPRTRHRAEPHAGAAFQDQGFDPAALRGIFSQALGIERDGKGLRAAFARLRLLAMAGHAGSAPARIGLMMALAALRREESRGAHWRIDFQERSMEARHMVLTLEETLAAADLPHCLYS